MSTTDFYLLEPVQLLDIIDRKRKQLEYEHKLSYIAFRNALGETLSDKYKYVDVFEEYADNKEIEVDEKEKLIEYFKSWD